MKYVTKNFFNRLKENLGIIAGLCLGSLQRANSHLITGGCRQGLASDPHRPNLWGKRVTVPPLFGLGYRTSMTFQDDTGEVEFILSSEVICGD